MLEPFLTECAHKTLEENWQSINNDKPFISDIKYHILQVNLSYNLQDSV